MSAVRSAFAPAGARALALPAPLLALLGAGLVLRLLFVGGAGFHNDVAAFESWALTLLREPPWRFYASTSFADYPPGYFVVLWAVGHLYGLLSLVHVVPTPDPDWSALRVLVKLPAIAMDLVDAALIWWIVRRWAPRLALAGAALLALNPAAIYNSAYWGQIDSVSWGLVLAALALLLAAGDDPAKRTSRVVWAWLALGFSVLIKPQGALVGLMLVAWAFAPRNGAERQARLRATLAGIGAAFVLAYALGALFFATANPVAVFARMLHQYAYGASVYPYTTVNAFDLYAVKGTFWQRDDAPFLGPLTQSTFGIVLVLGAAALVVYRYLQRRDEPALLEGAFLIALGFFCLATRMHERYVYGAFLLVMPLIAVAPRYRWAAGLLTVTTFLNLAYSLAYQQAVENHLPGANPFDLWPAVSHPAALANVLTFFALGYVYLGGTAGALGADDASAADAVPAEAASAAGGAARSWFSPREGIAAMTPRDHGIALAMALASFVICLLWIAYPAEKIFDEIYYARAGEEYLKGIEGTPGYGVFEYTHPPLTKLVVTLSMMLFGGLHGLGDTAVGWRFLDVVAGAVMVWLTYVFAKRLTGTTVGASLAGLMMLCDGFHFTQSRIATPEITVATFSLATLYAFYRLVLAAQVRARVVDAARRVATPLGLTMAAGLVVAIALAAILPGINFNPNGIGGTDEWLFKTRLVIVAYTLVAAWFLGRAVVVPLGRRAAGPPARETSYAEGTRVLTRAGALAIVPPESGEEVPFRGDRVTLGDDAEATRSVSRDGTLVYATPEGTARYAVEGVATVEGATIGPRDARIWVWALAFCAAALAASKWNGLFDVILVWVAAAGIAAQRWRRAPALYGNPFGIPLDVLVSGMIALGGAIYLACYTPYFAQDGHDLRDFVSLQHAMYQYHSTLKATHPYQSQWWQWPLLERPISYYYHDFRAGAGKDDPHACCVAEILALPNPLVWWTGLVTIPLLAWWAWRERHKGYALVVAAYVLQWLPWIGSPRIAFEYHFFPNLAMIVLANAVALERVRRTAFLGRAWTGPAAVGAYAVAVVALFAFFYPVLAGVHVTWDQWHARMWTTHWI